VAIILRNCCFRGMDEDQIRLSIAEDIGGVTSQDKALNHTLPASSHQHQGHPFPYGNPVDDIGDFTTRDFFADRFDLSSCSFQEPLPVRPGAAVHNRRPGIFRIQRSMDICHTRREAELSPVFLGCCSDIKPHSGNQQRSRTGLTLFQTYLPFRIFYAAIPYQHGADRNPAVCSLLNALFYCFSRFPGPIQAFRPMDQGITSTASGSSGLITSCHQYYTPRDRTSSVTQLA